MIYCVILELLLKVKDAIKKTRLSPHGQRPIVCIDEAQVTWHSKPSSLCRTKELKRLGGQVLDADLGWEGFRKDYGADTWKWITAATKPRLVQPIGNK